MISLLEFRVFSQRLVFSVPYDAVLMFAVFQPL